MRSYLNILLASLSLSFFVSCSATQSKNKQFLSDYSGFTQKSQLKDTSTYQGDLQKLSGYDKIFFEEIKVIPPADPSKSNIKNEEIVTLQNSFRSALQKGIAETRFKITQKPDKKTLSLRAAITEFQPGNPALFGASYAPYLGTAITVTKATTGSNAGAGSAVIEAEILDTNSRERFYAIIDKQTGTILNPQSGMSRWGHVELAFRQWATQIRKTISR